MASLRGQQGCGPEIGCATSQAEGPPEEGGEGINFQEDAGDLLESSRSRPEPPEAWLRENPWALEVRQETTLLLSGG